MEYVAPILKAVVSLLWVIFAFTALLKLKPEIARAMARLTKAEVLGQKIELRDDLIGLQVSAVATEKEVQALPRNLVLEAETGRYSVEAGHTEVRVDQAESLDATIKSILQQAESDPKLALITLAVELERRARHALATRGALKGRTAVPLVEALDELGQFGFPPNLAGSLKLFINVRNQIIHGVASKNDEAISAIDSGITLLRVLNALPDEKNIIYHPGVEIFFDEKLTQPIRDAKGVILETTSPGGATKNHRIFPTTLTNHQKGKRVSWEWNMRKQWPEAWYRDPDTGEIKKAWNGAAEFIGRPLDEI